MLWTKVKVFYPNSFADLVLILKIWFSKRVGCVFDGRRQPKYRFKMLYCVNTYVNLLIIFITLLFSFYNIKPLTVNWVYTMSLLNIMTVFVCSHPVLTKTTIYTDYVYSLTSLNTRNISIFLLTLVKRHSITNVQRSLGLHDNCETLRNIKRDIIL